MNVAMCKICNSIVRRHCVAIALNTSHYIAFLPIFHAKRKEQIHTAECTPNILSGVFFFLMLAFLSSLSLSRFLSFVLSLPPKPDRGILCITHWRTQ